jgi:predicted phosphodiesterase
MSKKTRESMTRMQKFGPVLYCGDPHSRFHHIIEAAEHTRASAVVLLGDLEPERPLHEELAPLAERELAVFFIHGNHDADSDRAAARVWGSTLADRNIHGRVVMLPDGTRLAGLGGVFRETVWHPSSASARLGAPAYRSRTEHARVTPRQDRWQGGPPRKHLGTIYPDEVDLLASLGADVLVTHEAPTCHPCGFALLDALAQVMGVKVTVHGHHHDRLDSSAWWSEQGFKSFGVGLRGITAIDVQGNAQVILPGELDVQRGAQREVK